MRPAVKTSLTIILTILLVVFGLSSVPFGAVITLGWDPVTESEDGSPMEDLAGYKIYCAKTPGLDKQDASIEIPLTDLIDVNNPTCTLVGLTLGQQYCFAITAYDVFDNESDLSDEACGVVTKKEVELVAPNGAEVLKSGNSYPIQWKVNGTKSPVTKVNLYYTTNGGVSYGLISTLAGNDRSYNWTAPTPLSNKKNTCYVKVVAYSGGTVVGSDRSDKPFTIEVVKITQPNGGETLWSNSSYPIQWEINGTKSPVTKVNLYYTTNGGVSYGLISTLAGNDRSYNWTPTVKSTKAKCKVKVVLYNAKNIILGSDVSDSYFTISP